MARLRNLIANITRFVPSAPSGNKASQGSHSSENRPSADANSRTPNRAPKGESVYSDAMQKVAAALFLREQQGKVTTLRNLHEIAELPQPEAMLALGRLQKAGYVRIEHNLKDAFSSEVILTEGTRSWFDEQVRRKSTRVG